jgi:hypothetical protein
MFTISEQNVIFTGYRVRTNWGFGYKATNFLSRSLVASKTAFLDH